MAASAGAVANKTNNHTAADCTPSVPLLKSAVLTTSSTAVAPIAIPYTS